MLQGTEVKYTDATTTIAMTPKRVAIVTGASVSIHCAPSLFGLTDNIKSGMGTALSIDLVSKGWQVAMADIQPNSELQQKLGEDASYHHCNVADYDSQATCFQEVWDKYGRLDALCANAGIVDRRYPHSKTYLFISPEVLTQSALSSSLIKETQTSTLYIVKENTHHVTELTRDTGSPPSRIYYARMSTTKAWYTARN